MTTSTADNKIAADTVNSGTTSSQELESKTTSQNDADGSTTGGGSDCCCGGGGSDVTKPTVATAASSRATSISSSSNHSSIAAASNASSAMDEEEDYPKTQQEELNEILEAFYEVISDEQIRSYQQYIEEIERQSLASKAIQAPEKAPDFEMMDQDGEMVRLSEQCQKGPVILVFYRGKWCPHCNAVIMNLQKILVDILNKGASIIAISPMLPDGTAVFATKRSLQFPVLGDVGNTIAKQYRLTFQVPEQFRSLMISFGENIGLETGNDLWELPLPATYIINQEGYIVWSFIDDDQHYRAEPADILAAIPTKEPIDTANNNDDDDITNHCNLICQRKAKAPPRWRRSRSRGSLPPPPPSTAAEESSTMRDTSQHSSNASGGSMDSDTSSKKSIRSSVKSKVMQVFGRKKQEPMEFLGGYLLGDN